MRKKKKGMGLGGMVVWAGMAVGGFLVGKRLFPEARRYLRLRRM